MLAENKLLVLPSGPKTGVYTLAYARMQRCSLILTIYQYETEYRKTHENANVELISRLVLLTEWEKSETEVYSVICMDECLITARNNLRRWPGRLCANEFEGGYFLRFTVIVLIATNFLMTCIVSIIRSAA